VRGEEPAPDLEQTAKLPPTGEEELPPGLVALLSETVRRGATDLLLVPGASPVVRVNGLLEKASGGEAVSAQTAFDLLSPSLSADRRRRSTT
jgi:Tfp pilus assembly pilus retraction ATPase PilT